MATGLFTPLSFNDAVAGLDLIGHERFIVPVAEREPLVHRMLVRLLDQLDARARPATEGEDTHLRRAIEAYGVADYADAVDNAFRAAASGEIPFLVEFDPPDRSVPLRDLLQSARARHHTA